MKQKILIMGIGLNERITTSLEVSNRPINQKDLDNFYIRIDKKFSNNDIRSIRVYLKIEKNKNLIYKHNTIVCSYTELMKVITDYVMIAQYENHR